jgi:hypothetical protein
VLRSVDLYDDADGERPRFDQVQVPGLRRLVEQRLSATQDQRLDQEPVLVDQVSPGQGAGKSTTAPDDDVGTGSGLDIGDLGREIAPGDPGGRSGGLGVAKRGGEHDLGESFIEAAYGSCDCGQYDDISW